MDNKRTSILIFTLGSLLCLTFMFLAHAVNFSIFSSLSIFTSVLLVRHFALSARRIAPAPVKVRPFHPRKIHLS